MMNKQRLAAEKMSCSRECLHITRRSNQQENIKSVTTTYTEFSDRRGMQNSVINPNQNGKKRETDKIGKSLSCHEIE